MSQESKAIKRTFEKDRLIASDLFRLEIASMRKNIGFDAKNPIWEGVPHIHFFHTRCSDGRVQLECSAVGGHKHKMIALSSEKSGEVTQYACGPAAGDNHTHDVTYIQSEEVSARIKNEKAASFIAGQV
jgi:hypothetical protein